MDARLFHQREITDRFGEPFWNEVIDRMTDTTIYSPMRCQLQLDNCVAYLLARASLDDPNADLVCNLEPDLAWHMFLLFTAEYCQFCQELAGTYLHHDPAPESALVNTAEATGRTIAVFEQEGIGYAPPLWRDHLRYPQGASVIRTGVWERELIGV